MIRSISAGGVVINPKLQVVIVSQAGKSWSLPKGHVEKGESEIEAAKREIEEESGIKQDKLTLIKKLGSYQRYRMDKNNLIHPSLDLKTIHIFLFKTVQNDLSPIDKHHPQAIWVNKDEVKNKLTFKEDREFFNSIVDKIK